MRIINRISTSITAALDRAVGSIENHDAVIEASISEIKRAGGELRARLNRVRADAARMEEKIAGLERNVQLWADRAVAASTSEEVALECIQRRGDCRQQAAQLSVSLKQLRSVEQRLVQNAEQIDQRLRELQQQRSLMRSRPAAAEACRTTELIYHGCGVTDIDRTLERWDAQIIGIESTNDVGDPADELERRFVAEEDRAALLAELETLKKAKEQ